MTSSFRGVIREKECSCYKQVEWNVDYASLPDKSDVLKSPTFKIGPQEYIFQLDWITSKSSVKLNLLRIDLFANDRVRCCMGVKRGDGSYHYQIESNVTDQETAIVCTNILFTDLLEKRCLDPEKHLSFFVRVNVDSTQEGRETCKRGHADVITSGEGRIREEECSGHKYVEWDVEYELIDDLNSPEFMIGLQRYLLVLYPADDSFVLHLYRMGPKVEHRIQCIMGLKRGDGSYDHRFRKSDLKRLEECEMWTDMHNTFEFDRLEAEKLILSADGRVTFFVRMDEECTLIGAEACIHGVSRMIPSSKGHLREETCSDHNHVEWDLEYELLQQYHTVTSPVFEIGGQRYLIELSYWNEKVRLSLFRMGRTSKGLVRYFLGAKHGDQSYDHRIKSGVFDHEEDGEVWTEVSDQLFFFITDLESSYLAPDGSLTFFVRLQFEKTSSGRETCSHSTGVKSTRGIGSVSEVKCDTYKQVDWTVNWVPSSTIVTSPSFSVEDTNYLWELCFDGDEDGCPKLQLYRMGSSVCKSVRWSTCLKRNDGLYESKFAKFDLEHEKYTMWQPVGFPLPLKEHLFGKDPLIVSFLISLERTCPSAKASTPDN